MKTTVQVEGKAVEVDIPGVIPETEVAQRYMPKDVFEAELSRRGVSIAEKQGWVNPAKLDEAGKQKLAESLGLKSAGDSGGSDVGKQVERAKAEWSERELKPVLEREVAAKSEIETLRRDRLTDNIVASAARAGIKGALLSPPIVGAKPPIVAMLEQAFAFDEKSRQWYARGANQDQPFAFAAQPTSDRPYKSVDEFVAEWSRLTANKEFVGVTTQSGPGLGGGGGSGRGEHRISREDARDPLKYRRAREAAAKAGVTLELEPPPSA